MSTERNYLPYDEVTLAAGSDPSRVVLTTPWVQFEFEAGFSSPEDKDQLISEVNAGDIHPGNYPTIHSIFTALERFPISYVLPRPQLAKMPSASDGASFPELETSREWSWDLEGAEAFRAFPAPTRSIR